MQPTAGHHTHVCMRGGDYCKHTDCFRSDVFFFSFNVTELFINKTTDVPHLTVPGPQSTFALSPIEPGVGFNSKLPTYCTDKDKQMAACVQLDDIDKKCYIIGTAGPKRGAKWQYSHHESTNSSSLLYISGYHDYIQYYRDVQINMTCANEASPMKFLGAIIVSEYYNIYKFHVSTPLLC
eukprot:m.76281 g.76281  ORF g.76281 m.76281 type:complete len:180 (-) comp14421_c0_seq45:62-601(-)